LGLKEAVTKFEANLVTEALTNCGGKVESAAQALRTSRSVIYHLINKHNLKDFVCAVMTLCCLGFSIVVLQIK
ncbi:MAG TPA: hypothetical protein VGA79_07930, partial [Desulfobaccales bacterium]